MERSQKCTCSTNDVLLYNSAVVVFLSTKSQNSSGSPKHLITAIQRAETCFHILLCNLNLISNILSWCIISTLLLKYSFSSTLFMSRNLPILTLALHGHTSIQTMNTHYVPTTFTICSVPCMMRVVWTVNIYCMSCAAYHIQLLRTSCVPLQGCLCSKIYSTERCCIQSVEYSYLDPSPWPNSLFAARFRLYSCKLNLIPCTTTWIKCVDWYMRECLISNSKRESISPLLRGVMALPRWDLGSRCKERPANSLFTEHG